jgi:hypothetical protein
MTTGLEARMAYLLLGAFVALVVVMSWFSYIRGMRIDSCCAPADPRHDLRMRGAFGDESHGPHRQ